MQKISAKSALHFMQADTNRKKGCSATSLRESRKMRAGCDNTSAEDRRIIHSRRHPKEVSDSRNGRRSWSANLHLRLSRVPEGVDGLGSAGLKLRTHIHSFGSQHRTGLHSRSPTRPVCTGARHRVEPSRFWLSRDELTLGRGG